MRSISFLSFVVASALTMGCDPADTIINQGDVYEGDEADVYEGDTTTTTENNYGDGVVETEPAPTFVGMTANGEFVNLTDDLLIVGDEWPLTRTQGYGILSNLETSMRTGLGSAKITGIDTSLEFVVETEEEAIATEEISEWDSFTIDRQIGNDWWMVGSADREDMSFSAWETSGGWQTRVDAWMAEDFETSYTFKAQDIAGLHSQMFRVHYFGDESLPTGVTMTFSISVFYEIDGIAMMPKRVMRPITLMPSDS